MYQTVCNVISGDIRVEGQRRDSDNTARWIIFRSGVEQSRFGFTDASEEQVKKIARKLLKKYSVE